MIPNKVVQPQYDCEFARQEKGACARKGETLSSRSVQCPFPPNESVQRHTEGVTRWSRPGDNPSAFYRPAKEPVRGRLLGGRSYRSMPTTCSRRVIRSACCSKRSLKMPWKSCTSCSCRTSTWRFTRSSEASTYCLTRSSEVVSCSRRERSSASSASSTGFEGGVESLLIETEGRR